MRLHKPILKHGLGNTATSLCHRVHSGELRLHISGKSRIGLGHNIDRLGSLVLHVERDPVLTLGNGGPCFLELVAHHTQ